MALSVPPSPPSPLKITDTTFRDGHQCTIATRMRTADLEPIADEMDRAGFYSVEMWGGATFDVMTRYLAEDPWERVRVLKRLMPKTPFQMLLRGQNLVGYRNYPDDVVRAFVAHSADVGIDIFRIFDALNDERNLAVPVRAVKECGKHAQAAICYSVTEGRLGGDIFNIEYFVNKALAYQDLGADSICIKDMAGIIAPLDARTLVEVLKARLRVPLQLHTHYTSGMASMAVLTAAEAGVDIVDACLAPLALRAAQPAVEPIVVTLQGTERDTGLDLDSLLKLGRHFEQVAPKYRDFLDTTKSATIDTAVLKHQIPGGMISNLVSQLREADALDRIREVYEELPVIRKDMGYPPLVTPTSQIVGAQAVNNVLFGRYKMITAQMKDYAYGLYGRPPVPMSEELVELALRDYPKGKTPIDGRAADAIDPEMAQARDATEAVAKDLGDVLTYALYPTTGMQFLEWKYGRGAAPPELHGKTLDDTAREDELIAKVKAGAISDLNGHVADAPPKGPATRSFNVYVAGEYFKVEVEPENGGVPGPATRFRASAPTTAAVAKPSPQTAGASPPQTASPVMAPGETAVRAPIPGILIRYAVQEGDDVSAGDIVVILEAMKMENALPTPIGGKVASLPVAPGARVVKDQVLAVIAG